MSWKKFGSPYDPSYEGSGKIERPQQAKLEQEQHRLRGCGNPSCPTCNPETASIASSASSSGSTWAYRQSLEDALRRSMESSFRDALMGSPRDFGAARVEFVGTPPPAGPPASYEEAREEVEKWIVAAPEQAFADIVGNDAALEQLRDAIQAPVNHKDLYEAYGMKMPKGAMLSGHPGCGKTMFARAAASEMKKLYGETAEFISISGSELQSMYVGETERRIKAIFVYAREYKAYHGHPLLVFIDEAEVLLPDRTGRVRRVAPWEESQVATFLAEMDGMQESGAFVLLATNRPGVIDQAVLRDGRCDFKIVVQRPTVQSVESIIRKNFGGVLLGETDKLEDLVFAAVESLHDPHKIIVDAHAMKISLKGEMLEHQNKHFLLEHIVSGAMAASIPNRAKRYAFTRDKADGVARGVTVADVVKAVSDLFEENRGLDHAFAFDEFKREFMKEAKEATS